MFLLSTLSPLPTTLGNLACGENIRLVFVVGEMDCKKTKSMVAVLGLCKVWEFRV